MEQTLNEENLKWLIKALETPGSTGAYLVAAQPVKALETLKKLFTFIQAAGGLVQSEKGNLLLIFRRGKWDLPKGKLDDGENLDQCALREVEEETGLQHVVLKQPLCRTYHTYHQDGQHCLKESHWYLMGAPEQNALKPQTEEDIEQAIWIAPSAVAGYLPHTHRNVADVLQLALPLLQA